MLELDRLELSIGPNRWEFDLSLDTHGVHALLGRSGSGKSTLLNLIAGFIQPDKGDIRWNAESLLPLEPAHRPVTSLFQQQNLFNHLSVRQNVGLGIDPGLKLNDRQIHAIQSVLDDVGLSGQETKLPGTLSGGEQQRVALARSLLRQRPILLLDEPFSALDAQTRQEMITLLRQLIDRHRPCVIMVTHDEDDAIAMQAEVLRLVDGRVVREA